jgi:hypothetical protein
MFSTEVLKLWAAVQGRYVKRDLNRAAPNLVLREADGREVIYTDEQGRQVHVNLPDEMLDDYLRQSFAARDEDGVYRLTPDGLARGRS